MLASGGLDSAALLWAAVRRFRRVYPLYVRAGLVWEGAERHWLQQWLAHMPRDGTRIAPVVEVSVASAPLYGRTHWSVSGQGVPGTRASLSSNYLPGRNLLLLAIAAVLAARTRVHTLGIATLGDNPFADATQPFFRTLERAAAHGLGHAVRIWVPFRHCHKEELISSSPFLPWALTFSCAAPVRRRHCGRCTKCAERRAAFRAAGISDPTTYAAPVRRVRS